VCGSADRVEERVPSLHKLSRRIAFNDLADDHLIRHSHRLHLSAGPMGVATARLKFVFYAATITILLGPFRQSDRIPNRLSACIDHNAVELSCGRFVHSHRHPFSDLALISDIGELCLNWVTLDACGSKSLHLT
jgi:hypothetical protein